MTVYIEHEGKWYRQVAGPNSCCAGRACALMDSSGCLALDSVCNGQALEEIPGPPVSEAYMYLYLVAVRIFGVGGASTALRVALEAARKVSGPCGPDGRLYLGPVDEPAAPPPPKPRSYWISRRAGCLAAAGICIVFWLLVILAVTLGRN